MLLVNFQTYFDQPSFLLDCTTVFTIQHCCETGKGVAYGNRIYDPNLKAQNIEIYHLTGKKKKKMQELRERNLLEIERGHLAQLSHWIR